VRVPREGGAHLPNERYQIMARLPGPAPAADQAMRLVAYGLLALLPAATSVLSRRHSLGPPLLETGRALALVGFSTVALQFVLAARWPWAERPFGLDRLYRFHRTMAVVATALLAAHPLLVAIGGYGTGLVTGLQQPWFVWAGKTGLRAVMAMVLVAALRARIGLGYRCWRLLHRLGAGGLLALAILHLALGAGEGHRGAVTLTLCLPVLAALLAQDLLPPLRSLYRPAPRLTVESVRPEARRVWTLTLRSPEGWGDPGHLPGQFRFLSLGAPAQSEEHPFTVASASAADGTLAFTIKESGDFTRQIGGTQPGQTATVSCAFGRFSYLVHPDETDLVFIAGGIGITPLMAMLRHLRGSWDRRRIQLLYANRTEADIVFRDELAQMEAVRAPALRVTHVLSRAGDEWTGERGRLDAERLRRLVGEAAGKAFYVCGPPAMTRDVMRALKSLGVPRRRLHYEYFAL
jgi:predicted ferric reductase